MDFAGQQLRSAEDGLGFRALETLSPCGEVGGAVRCGAWWIGLGAVEGPFDDLWMEDGSCVEAGRFLMPGAMS